VGEPEPADFFELLQPAATMANVATTATSLRRIIRSSSSYGPHHPTRSEDIRPL
jgi:hypothetical protein